MRNIGLVPLQNFASLDRMGILHRSAQPIFDYQYGWMKNVLGIETIINLRKEKRIDDRFAPNHGIKVINIDVIDHHPPTIEQCNQFMDIIKQNKNPLLFHCEHGHGRTSTFCVLSRLAKGWSLEEALKEEEERFHYNFKHHSQVDFLINNFGVK